MLFQLAAGSSGVATVIGILLGYVVDVFRTVGAIIAVWGLGQTVFAFKNDDADAKQRGITMAVIGTVLISIKSLVSKIPDLPVAIGEGFLG